MSLAGTPPVSSEVALWLRGFENFFCDMIENPDFMDALLDIICEIKMKYWGKALQTVGKNVMIVSEADDLCSQTNCLPVLKCIGVLETAPFKTFFIHKKIIASSC